LRGIKVLKVDQDSEEVMVRQNWFVEVEKMEDVLKAIAKGLFVQQSVNVGSKIINNNRVTKSDEQGFWLSLLFFGLMNLPAPQPLPNTLARRY
jgi:hypothetical protein